jgi:hypothetical protein
MSSDTTAIIIAGISGAVSLAAAAWVEWSRRRTASQLQDLQTKQADKLERLRSEQAKELEEFKDHLTRRHETTAKADEAARLVNKYRDPLLRSAFDLQSRIWNVYEGGFRGRRDPEYFRLNTLFLLAELLGWLEIIRREMQFLDLGGVDATKNLGLKISRVEGLLASTGSMRDDCYVYRGHQRAIGELMLNRINGDLTGRRHECMGYAAFVAAQSDPQFAKWFTRLGDAFERLPDDKPVRLALVQSALIDLIDLLDPACERYEHERRHRLNGLALSRAASLRPAETAT